MKAIILAAFGSIYEDAVNKSLGKMADKIRGEYPDYLVRTIFLSEALIEKWNQQQSKKIKGLLDTFYELAKVKVDSIYIQPFTLVNDQCYRQLCKQTKTFLKEEGRQLGMEIAVGKPLLSSLGVKNYTDDYVQTIEAIQKHIGTKGINQTLLLMANGQNQLELSTLQLKCLYGVAPRTVVFTSNGFPNFKQSLSLLKGMSTTSILLLPLTLIGSEHLFDYLGGERSDSIQNLLAERGYKVTIWREGLGENPHIQNLFLSHLQQTIRFSERRQNKVLNTTNEPNKVTSEKRIQIA